VPMAIDRSKEALSGPLAQLYLLWIAPHAPLHFIKQVLVNLSGDAEAALAALNSRDVIARRFRRKMATITAQPFRSAVSSAAVSRVGALLHEVFEAWRKRRVGNGRML